MLTGLQVTSRSTPSATNASWTALCRRVYSSASKKVSRGVAISRPLLNRHRSREVCTSACLTTRQARPLRLDLERKHRPAAIAEFQSRHIGTGRPRGVDADQIRAHLTIGGDRGDDPFGDEQSKTARIEAAASELLQTERDHALRGHHDRQAVSRLDDGGSSLVEIRERAVAHLGLREPTVVQRHDSKRRAMSK